MAKPKVEVTNSFNDWRLITNTLSDQIGDMVLISPDQTFTASDVVSTLNDLYTKKLNRSGDTITGSLTIDQNLVIGGTSALTGVLTANGNIVLGLSKITLNSTSGNIVGAGNLDIAGTTSLSGTLSAATNKFTVSSAGNLYTAGTLTVTGESSFNSLIRVGAGAFTVDLTGNVVAQGSLVVHADATLHGGSLIVTDGAGTPVTKFSVDIAGNTAIAGTLGVAGIATFNESIVSTLGTLTASKPVLSATQTWNNAGAAFQAITVDVTDTASSPASMLLRFRKWNSVGSAFENKFSVDVDGAMYQRLSGSFLARDIVAGSRHIREYQDLADDGVQGLPGNQTDKADSYEWGFTWNANWVGVGTGYAKDRSNAGDHAFMYRLGKRFTSDWYLSDGTTGGSAILWEKKVSFDLPNSTYTFQGLLTAGTVNAQNLEAGTIKVGTVTSYGDYEIVTNTTGLVAIATVDATVFRSAMFEIQAHDTVTNKHHKTHISAIHDGTTADSVEYGAVATGGVCGTFSVAISGSSMFLYVAAASANNTVFKIHSRLMKL